MSLHAILLKKKINHALLWALIEACGYKTVYLILHISLFKIFPSSLYSLQATIFAILYMGVTIFNRGFDQSLLYHFNQYAFSQSGLRELFKNMVSHIGITLILVLTTKALITSTDICAPIFCNEYKELGFFLILLLLIEIIKKNLKVVLYLTFYNRYIALAELIGLTLYTCSIIYTFRTEPYSLEPIFKHLLYINSSIVIFFTGCLYAHYRKNNTLNQELTYTYNTNIQYQSYFLQLSKTIISSQFLMPFYVIAMQLTDSAHFFVISTIIQSGEFILYKLCYVSGSTFFVYDTSENNFLGKHMISILLKRLIPFYIIVVLIAWTPIFYMLPITPTNIYFTLLYGATLLIDNFLLLYEKYAIIHNRILTYFFYYTSLSIITWSLLYTLKESNIFITISLFFIGKTFLSIFIYNKDENSNVKH
jgi:hypothetical protein